MSLPKSKSRLGYSEKEIQAICKARKISMSKFWKAFGVNTVSVENGESRYYRCDVERALYELNCNDGVYHAWD
jgi:hypothetical protein